MLSSMPKVRPLFFTYKEAKKSFRGRDWYVSGFTSGKRVQLWFKTEKEAKAAAADRNAEIKAHGIQISLSPVARIQAIDAAEKLAPYKKSISDAVEFYIAHLERQQSSVDVAYLCDLVLDEFERRYERKEISNKHLTSMRETIKKFRGRFADQKIKLLDGVTIKNWLASLPLAVKTRNRHRGYIKNMFGMALEWNLIDLNPLVKTSSFNDPHAKGFKVTILTPEEMAKFLTVADPDFIPFFALNAFSGLRREEIKRLDWSEVKLDRNRIDLPFTKSKNGKRKLIEVSDNLVTWLQPHVQSSGSVMPRKKLQLAFEAAAKNAEIIPWRQNALRHSFCSYAVASKGFEWTAAQADHSVRMLREHYWEVVSKEEAEKYWAIKP